MQVIKPEKIIEKITNLKTGEEYKDDNEWKSKGVPEEDIRRDIKLIMPSLDIFGKTKQNSKMAITNAQQYQQLVNKPASGKRPGYRGSDYASIAGDSRAANTSAKNTSGADYGGGNQGGGGSGSDGQGNDYSNMTGQDIRDAARAFEVGVAGGYADLDTFKEKKPEVKTYGLTSIFKTPLQKFSNFSAGKNRPYFINEVVRAGKIPGLNFGTVSEMTEEELEDAYQNYMSERLAGNIDAYGNPLIKNDGDGQENLMPQFVAQAPVTEEPEVDPDSLEGMLANRTAYRFMADGGMTNDAPVEGGIMDLESGRQMYFLGKLVKKATRAVKKIAKSPIGIAALTSFIPFGKTKSSLFNRFMGTGLGKTVGGFFGDMNKADKIKLALGAGLTAAPLLFQEEEEEQPDYASNRGPGLDINAIRANPYNTMGQSYRFYAEGGDVEPVAKKTMPLLDMDGKEMDLRKDGGFVPIGRMERADDVPARLSKNEFVFTADAVRNAGDGDIDKGAEVMYNMMKNLESGGEISEESQGLDGAREMFQTSQRLEEVL